MTGKAADIVIYHNPKCSTSRKVLGMLQDAGVTPRVIDYVRTPPTRRELVALLKRMGMTPRELLRRRGTPYDELGLVVPSKSDEALIDAILAHPILMERPVVVTPKGAAICRPPERVRDLLA